VKTISVILAAALTLAAQVGPPRPMLPPAEQEAQKKDQAQKAPPEAKPPASQAAKPQPGSPTPPTPPAANAAAEQPAAQTHLADDTPFLLNNVSLTEMIDILAKRLKINYILDPAVKGSVTIYTYGEVKPVELMPLLETVLRVNGFAMVKVGDLYRIVPTRMISQLPLDPQVNADPKTLPDDERMILNLVFLKYATAAEMDRLIVPFMGEGATHSVYDPANLLLIEDNSRSMKRTMNLIAMFDSDTFAGQRVRLFEVENSRPSDLVKDLDTVFKAYALSDKASGVKFIPVDRINVLIAVAPNPGIFDQVQSWIKKLDVAVKITAGAVSNYVYRLKYGRAETVAMAIMALYTGNASALIGMAAMNNASMIAGGMGMGVGMGMGMGGGYGYGQGMGYGQGQGYNYGGMGYGGGYQGGMGYPGAYGGGYGGGYPYGGGGGYGGYQNVPQRPAAQGAARTEGGAGGADQTGTYLGAGYGEQNMASIPHVIPDPFNNTLLIQATPQDWEQIKSLLQQLDVAPRQVLIDAKIYEVDLTEGMAGGVETFLQQAGSSTSGGITGNGVGTTGSSGSLIGGLTPSTVLSAAAGPGGLALTTGALVLKSHQLLALLTAQEQRGKSRVISAPSIIATDSIPATMNVGSQVPVLTSQAVAGGVQSGGNSVFTNTVSNQSSGVTLSMLAQVNSSGIVTMVINQQVSSPQPPSSGAAIQSPSFQNRSVTTQVTVQDGDTVAIGGIITESHTESSGGVPFLHRIPILGAAFGAKNYSTQRTELIIFLTPRVIYDTNQLTDASEELKSNLKRVQKLIREQ